MPLVTVYYWTEFLSDETKRVLKEKLPIAVANHLTIEEVREAWLGPEDIEVLFEYRAGGYDKHHTDIAIRVEAMYFPERQKIVNQASEEISEDLDKIIAPYTFFVWVVLVIAGYHEQLRPD